MSALDAWARWSCAICWKRGESVDYDAAARDFRAHVLSAHFPPGAADVASGLALSLAEPESMGA